MKPKKEDQTPEIKDKSNQEQPKNKKEDREKQPIKTFTKPVTLIESYYSD